MYARDPDPVRAAPAAQVPDLVVRVVPARGRAAPADRAPVQVAPVVLAPDARPDQRRGGPPRAALLSVSGDRRAHVPEGPSRGRS